MHRRPRVALAPQSIRNRQNRECTRVGVVYNTLLADAGLNSFNLQWSNDILHIIIPIYAVLDWILLADRPRLPCCSVPACTRSAACAP
ncbi:Pr6Pr family membrane protein [Cryobacterium sp. TMT1-2-2]|uniref:Pr6Pr family membrane protein n=1 Tax=Cryobacterium sp. TMT1-2-2 TaxID=1259233 RepID=UPI00141B4000|nr:Pr6Pr family membrane protein [Cryobacterium sp. TMT1-2-2]